MPKDSCDKEMGTIIEPPAEGPSDCVGDAPMIRPALPPRDVSRPEVPRCLSLAIAAHVFGHATAVWFPDAGNRAIRRRRAARKNISACRHDWICARRSGCKAARTARDMPPCSMRLRRGRPPIACAVSRVADSDTAGRKLRAWNGSASRVALHHFFRARANCTSRRRADEPRPRTCTDLMAETRMASSTLDRRQGVARDDYRC